jgi:hypothetical protein
VSRFKVRLPKSASSRKKPIEAQILYDRSAKPHYEVNPPKMLKSMQMSHCQRKIALPKLPS